QVWMGDLDPSWTEESISSIWVSFGEKPVGVKIMRDKSASAKPAYCFVTFENPDIVARAMQKNGMAIPGSPRVLKLNFASAGGNNRFSGPATGQSGFAKGDSIKNENSIFVGDLGAEVTESVLSQKFSEKYPSQIRQVKIMVDPSSKVSKGFGFVRFYSSEAQKRALTEMNGVTIGSRPIRVGLAAGSAAQLPIATAMKADSPDVSKIQIVQAQPSLTQFTDPNNTTVVIRGLSSKFTEQELEAHFQSFGDIVYTKLSNDYNSAYVKFHLRHAAENAILFLHGAIINGSNLKVTWGNDNEAQNGSKAYQISKEIPIFYGHLQAHNVNYANSDLKAQATVAYEGSERLPVSKANELYLKSKLHKQQLLEGAMF
ncbi:RNA-binding domain-containing protein, partial [Suhomyces tanzawaensis NRRL Y-17324]